MRRIFFLPLLLTLLASPTPAQLSPAFASFQNWRAAVLSGDSSALSALYSKSPEAQLLGVDKKPIPLQDELAFWSSWKSKGLTDLSAQLVKEDDSNPDLHALFLQLTLTTKEGTTRHKQFIAVVQQWSRQGDHWLLVSSQHAAPALLRQPLTRKDLYPADADANKEIAETLHSAAATHRRVLIVFGGNWCFDCHVLDEAFHSPEIAPTLDKSFLVLHVDIGRMDKNLDIAKKYDVPLDRGVPALAVLDSDGKLLFSQKRGEFEAARSMAPEDILAFLNKWKPPSSK
jgi:ketosteroid isomerase-like protein